MEKAITSNIDDANEKRASSVICNKPHEKMMNDLPGILVVYGDYAATQIMTER